MISQWQNIRITIPPTDIDPENRTIAKRNVFSSNLFSGNVNVMLVLGDGHITQKCHGYTPPSQSLVSLVTMGRDILYLYTYIHNYIKYIIYNLMMGRDIIITLLDIYVNIFVPTNSHY